MSTHGAKYYDIEEEFLRSLYDISDHKLIIVNERSPIISPTLPLAAFHNACLIVQKTCDRFRTTGLFTVKWMVWKNRFGPSNVSLSLKARQVLFDRYVVLAERSGRATPLNIAEVRAKLLT